MTDKTPESGRPRHPKPVESEGAFFLSMLAGSAIFLLGPASDKVHAVALFFVCLGAVGVLSGILRRASLFSTTTHHHRHEGDLMGLDIPATGRVMPDEAYQDQTTEHERDAIDIGLRRAAHLVPTEPGSYVDTAGATWVLDEEGAWTDSKGDRRPPGHSPIIGLLIQKHGAFRPISTAPAVRPPRPSSDVGPDQVLVLDELWTLEDTGQWTLRTADEPQQRLAPAPERPAITMPHIDPIDTHLDPEKTRTLHVGIARPLAQDLVSFFQGVFPPGAAFANGDLWECWYSLPRITTHEDVLHVVAVVPDNEPLVAKVVKRMLRHGVPLVVLEGRPTGEVAYLTPTASWLVSTPQAWSIENREPLTMRRPERVVATDTSTKTHEGT